MKIQKLYGILLVIGSIWATAITLDGLGMLFFILLELYFIVTKNIHTPYKLIIKNKALVIRKIK